MPTTHGATQPSPPAPPGRDPLAVGVMLPRDLPAADVLPFARRADALGFAELWVVEDLGFRGGIAQAGAVLAATGRIRVGIGILPVATRSVAFAAMEVGTLAELFPGRLDVGLGHGISGWLRQAGCWPASPMTMLREHTTALRALLRGETVSVAGRYVRLDGVRLESPPPVVPLVLAGVRGPRSLALSGELADGTILAEPATPAYVRDALADVGDRPGHRVVAYDAAYVDDDAVAARRAVRPGLAWIGEPDWAVHVDPLPYAAELRALRASCRDREEFTERLPDAWVDDLTISGPPGPARARLGARHAAGVTSSVLIPAGSDPVLALEGLARLL